MRKNHIKRIAAAIVTLIVCVIALAIDTDYMFNGLNAAASDESFVIVDNTCTINCADDLAAFSNSYQQDPAKYQKVNLYIAIASGSLSELGGFVSIGTALYPFSGKITAGSSELSFTLDKPLFSYVMDSVGIMDSSGISRNITISRSASADSPLFAENVLHNTESAAPADWNITAVTYKDSDDVEYAQSFSGVIGTLWDNASVSLSITNNTVTADGRTGDIVSNSNTGIACCTMGLNSSLTVSLTGTNTAFNVTSENANAGGIVGTMAKDSTLTVNGKFHTDGTITAEKYAGGLVGRAKNAAVNFADPDDCAVESTIIGTLGTGGIFGYFDNTDAELTISGYDINCVLNGGNSGGIYGELNNGGKITIDGSNKVTASRTASEKTNSDFGGLIGIYTASVSEAALNVADITVTVNKSAAAGNYGGAIGVISDGAYGNNYGYVNFSGVTVNAGGCRNDISTNFGGFVGSSNKAFIDAENIKLITNGEYVGGGIVGNLNSGVLRLSGFTDLSGTAAVYEKAKNSGQLVGGRGQALVYARNGWKLIRGSAAALDDIGSWGEVLRLNADTLTEESVLTVDEAAHTVTVKPADTTITSLADFAALALNIQLNTGDIGPLLFDSGSASTTLLGSDITLTTNINLAGTGITGLTRDDGVNAPFTGTLNGGGCTVTLATGEAYGFRGNDFTNASSDEAGSGIICYHRYNGLFAQTDGAAFSDITIDGSINVNVKDTSGFTFVGGLSGVHTGGAFSISSVTADEKITVNGGCYTNVYVGGVLGRINENAAGLNVNISDSSINSVIYCTGSNRLLVGGAIGEISSDYSFDVNAENVTISAQVTNLNTDQISKVGAFIANISNYNGNSTGSRTLSLNNIIVDGASVTSAGGYDGGALLGEAWNNTYVTVGNSAGNGIIIRNSTVSTSGSGGFAGIVTDASGYWKVYDIEVQSITVVGASAQSFGVLINKGKFNDYGRTFALYLELQNENAFRIQSAELTRLKSGAVFDELLATCSDNYSEDVCISGKAVVSIHTSGETLIMDGTGCNTYQNRSGRNATNRNTRYYYNLDVFREKTAAELNDSEKLMLWSVCSYAYDNIKKYFANSITAADNVIPAGNYNMTGYSYYPIDCSSDVTVSAGCSFVFCNAEIESGESGTGNSDSMARSTVANNSQHYLMHCGLLRNVSANLTVNGSQFGGNVGNSGGSGALVCGTFGGSVNAVAVLNLQNIVLDGIVVNDLTGGYAPLLVNKLDKNLKAVISDISAAKNVYSGTAATSLFGDVGSDSADNIKITFSGIVLDGRKSEGTLTALDNAYGTDKSIFSKAILLNSFRYQSGKACSAVYNFKYAEDWNSDKTAVHKVAYGSEISASTEYPEKQRQYIDSDYYTNPEAAESTVLYSFSAFLPYVATAYNEAEYYHEIKVNHKNTTNLDTGCGTYNDPYIIRSSDQLSLVADILNDETPANDGIIINYHTDNYNSWCEERSAHIGYSWKADTGVFADENGNEMSVDDIRTALSTAYYKLDNDINLSASFVGLGKITPFKGVIDGAGYAVTNQNTNPFIFQSTGAVVKDLSLRITADFKDALKATADSKYMTDSGGYTEFYGGVIGIVNGGDNIIDNVNVTFDKPDTINTKTGSYYANKAVGGYIGVVRYGGVIFRNMDSSDTGLAANSLCKPANDRTEAENTKPIFLYCNPIIGRVIDGYALHETTAYNGAESGVTLHNGVKNYSVTDIDINAPKLTFSNFEHPTGLNSVNSAVITAPDAQSLFILGCISMSGAGSAPLNGAYPTDYSYGGGQMVRHGAYDMIGGNDATDFALTRTDNYANSAAAVPYIIYKYTTSQVMAADNSTVVSYPARSITDNNCVYNIELSGGLYDMPDGFRGIGSLNSANENLEMYIYGINGNGSTIELNSNFYVYRWDYERYYKVNGWKKYYTGLGLFNSLIQNKNSVTPSDFLQDTTGKYTISDITLSGAVNYQVFRDENGSVEYENKAYFSCAGGLSGVGSTTSVSCTIQLDNVSISDLYVNARQVSGGLIGYSANGSVTIKGGGADKLTVGSGLWTGGLIGYLYNSSLLFDGSNASGENAVFADLSVSALISGGGYTNDIGVGGMFGNFISDKQKTAEIKNFDIRGGKVVSGVKESFVGGVLGLSGKHDKSNQITLTLDNINIESFDVNKDITTNVYTGGVVGTLKAGTKSAVIHDVHLNGGSEGSTICGYTQSGGIGGLILCDLTVDGCSVENYTMFTSGSSETAGGFFAKIENDKTVLFTNSLISNCTIKQGSANKPAGGLIGHCTVNMKLKGYNIVSNNVQVTDADGKSLSGSAYAGDITGYIESGSVDLVGVSMLKSKSGLYAGKNIGTNKGSSFVIFADHDGVCLSGNANNTAPTFNTDNNVADMGAYPYATVNPFAAVDGTNILTGDGISMTAAKNIINDIKNSSVTAYKNVTSSDTAAFEGYAAKLSSFREKINSDKITDAQNFPVLVINESNYSRVTDMINSYIHILTNDSSISNYAEADANRCRVEISSYSMNGAVFEKRTDSSTLEIRNGYFRMTDSDYDSSYDSQFTLIDIQYFAPNDTSKVAYHLYIPVYVEKMLKFDFRVAALSGTKYNTSLYTAGNPVMESYGTPVTLYLSYSYLRTAQEWQDAINSGENLMKGYGKSVILSGNYDLPNNTKLVLVDRNNYCRAYYSSIQTAFDSSGKTLSPGSFADCDGVSFSPISLGNLLEKSALLTAVPDVNGTLVKCADDETALATIQAGGSYFRRKSDTDTDTSALYSISVTAQEGMTDSEGILILNEDYYISFFTEADNNQPMRNITVSCPARLGDDGMTPSRLNNGKSEQSNVHMILGNLYDQSFTFETIGDEVIDENNNTITANMNAVVSLKPGNADDVKAYLTYKSIHLYHGFIIEAARTDEDGMQKGIRGAPYVSGEYIVGDTSQTVSFHNTDSVIIVNGNGTIDIKQYLINSNSVTISCNGLRIAYTDDTGIIEQFPERKSESSDYGVVYSASSNLAYVADNIEHSNITAVPAAADGKNYYRSNISTVSLIYNIPYDSPNEMVNFGINGREVNGEVTAIGYYNTMNVPEQDFSNAAQVKFVLNLYRKNTDGTYNYVDIDEYLREVTLDGQSCSLVSVSGANAYEHIFDIDELIFEAGTFEVKSAFSVITGDEFELSGKTYANYKVQLTAQLLDNYGDPISGTECSDHIIYTNAKIYTNLIVAG